MSDALNKCIRESSESLAHRFELLHTVSSVAFVRSLVIGWFTFKITPQWK